VQNFLRFVSGRNDIVLAVLLICIVFMMILPLPILVVDVLIAVNLAISAVLLMAAMYLNDVTKLSAFPSILLLTTLFRLALAISTTRLILIQANAGSIIETFGNFVIGGNLVVGLVVFLILTIVNFMVITKGSERVAEVSARFSLDAMPGKQMSIDSDMRAGLIELDEAKRRRNKLEKESQLFGAMDGAMKFVKGDAIAGLIIIAVNMIGGITIGTMQRGMTVGDAARRYVLLTIGDGLIQQIPALFVSITAGFIVTRVASEDNKDLGSDIGAQLIDEPKALMITAGIMAIFAVIPGFPAPVFGFLAILFALGGYFIMKNRSSVAGDKKSREMPSLAPAIAPAGTIPAFPDETDAEQEAPVEPVTFALTVPVILDVAASMRNHIKPTRLDREIAKLRRALYFDLGVPFPGINLRLNENLKEGEYRILVNEIPIASGTCRPGFVIVRESEANLNLFDVPFEKGDDFLPITKSLWVSEKQLPLLQKAGLQHLNMTGILTFHLGHVLKAHASKFVGIQETMYLMNQMQKNFGELVKEVTRTLPIITITDIMQRLVGEDVSIRDMRTILEALVEWGQREKDPIILTEHVRGALSNYITYKFSAGQNVIPAYLMAKEVEDEIRGAVRQTSGSSYLALSPDVHRSIIASMKETIGEISAHTVRPVLMAPMDIRRFTRRIIERDFSDLPVLSYQELAASANIQPLDRIRLRK
jgi:type III secretion protein V